MPIEANGLNYKSNLTVLRGMVLGDRRKRIYFKKKMKHITKQFLYAPAFLNKRKYGANYRQSVQTAGTAPPIWM